MAEKNTTATTVAPTAPTPTVTASAPVVSETKRTVAEMPRPDDLPGDAKLPKYETPRTAAASPAPRKITSIERAPKGLTRFKCREDRPDRGTPPVYVLAQNADDAERFFRNSIKEAPKGGNPVHTVVMIRELVD